MTVRQTSSALCSCMLRAGNSSSGGRTARARSQAQRALLHSSRVDRLEQVSSGSSESAPISPSKHSTASEQHSTEATPGSQAVEPRIFASLLLSRPPFLTRTPTSFESAIFDYNAKLHRLLAQPFPKDFYFKKGSAAEGKFDELEAERQRTSSFPSSHSSETAKDTAGKGKEKRQEAAASSVARTDAADEVVYGASAENAPDKELYAVLPRRTAADEANDVKSLERQGERTLYLVVKAAGQKGWRFPADEVDRSASPAEADSEQGGADPKDSLHHAAPRAVRKLLGNEMDIWMVTNAPVGLLKNGDREKTYFLPAHILAGNAEQDKNVDFGWLTKEEIEEGLVEGSEEDKSYWKTVGKLLTR
ncbi:hypothetical protein K437DRAFT_253990 [Tilletiaria anomala UBC 951]|uniref:Large ribosomal subunit protein mL46 n=1 Tax=Tilletiaria anomala (strain ATCC 24038 / CBS 436.72 / UBC 951) TaxID=1037660 RepID=A0A066WFL2_TILAU|nr:uncharacterized protein K437DRAFT_253990 [Tilletiaria anomala UBC 951]KDN52586.1 hypothetical protein K437DRAFT_253990 [Tilletiaria anomala UBC 951]